jgi:drug/metabolite transporter (DMT)-like permease
MNTESTRLQLKTRAFTAIVVLSNVLGNFSLSWGLRRVGGLLTLSPLAYIEALFNPWVALGVGLLVVWMLSNLTLLSWADLSYVLPVTSVGYVLAAVTGRFFLHENITSARWTGILLIMLGVALVGRTAPRTRKIHIEPPKAAAAGVGQ